MRNHIFRGVWLGMALLALTLSGCGAATTHTPKPTAAPRTTATAIPLPSLAWTPVKLPTTFNATGQYLAISPVDGHDAWMCRTTSANTYAIWKTTDAGQSWSKTGSFTYVAPMAGASCGLNADMNGTSALLATIGWGCGECGNLASASLFSVDGAAHWRPLPGIAPNGQFATVRGGVIALMDKSAAGPQGEAQYLAFSSDGFQTWRAMSAQGIPTPFFHFAISPDDAIMIGAAYNNTLWRSNDLGAHWTRLPSPDGGQTAYITWLPQRSTFLLCGPGNGTATGYLGCSTDYGAHWNQVTTLSYTEPCPFPGKCGQGVTTTTQGCGPIAVEPDGTLVATCEPNQTTPFPASGPPSTIVYLWPLGVTTWQPVGLTHCFIQPIPTSGPVWCSTATPDQITGYETGQLPG